MEQFGIHDDSWFEEESRKFHAKGPDALDNEGVVYLAEAILTEIRSEMEHVVRAYQMSPDDKGVLSSVKNMNDLLNSKFFYALTLGHGAEIIEKFRERCDINDGSRKDDKTA